MNLKGQYTGKGGNEDETNQLSGFSPRYTLRKTGTPKKLLDTTLIMQSVWAK